MSSIKIVKARIVDLLDQSLPQTEVIYGPLTTEAQWGRRVLTVGGIDQGLTELDAMYAGTMSERYSFECQISVDVLGSDQRRATEQALDDYAAVKIILREFVGGHDLGLATPVQILPTGEFSLREKADNEGRHALISFGIAVVAQVE